jgi:hypothetical protein
MIYSTYCKSHGPQYGIDRPLTTPIKSTIESSDLQFHQSMSLNNEQSWREKVCDDISINIKSINASDKNIYRGKSQDPLTNIKDVLRNLSNREAIKYMRQCRLIVAKLQSCWVDLNEEIKSLVKTKEYIESTLESIRKELIINQETKSGRLHRPENEPVNIIYNKTKIYKLLKYFFH